MHAAATSSFPLRCYWLEAKYEFLRLLRTPSFAVPSLVFPALFYLLFGVLLGTRQGGPDMARYMLAGYGVFGIMGAGLFGFGVTVASERERGWLTFKRALPMPPGTYLLAKMAMAMMFAATISVILMLLGAFVAKVSLQPEQWALLFAINVFGVLPFCAIGLLIGTMVGASAAPAVVNVLYLPMAFLSGLWLPLQVLPPIFATLAPVWPSYHLSRIAMSVAGSHADNSVWLHLAVLVVVTVALSAWARARLARCS